MPHLLYLPAININTFLLFTRRGNSFRLRDYSSLDGCHEFVPKDKTADQILESAEKSITVMQHDVQDFRYWHDTIHDTNRLLAIGGELIPPPDRVPGKEHAPKLFRIPLRDKGSFRHQLDLVSSPGAEQVINKLLEGTGAELVEHGHCQPRGRASSEDWNETDIESYLELNPIPGCPCISPDWWIPYHSNRSRRPTWDLICQIQIDGRLGLLLVEAKARTSEIKNRDQKSPPNAESPKSVANDFSIRLRLAEASLGLRDIGLESVRLSANQNYQLSNRLAYAWKLASTNTPVVLMYLGWLNSPDWSVDPIANADHWEQLVSSHLRALGAEGISGKKRVLSQHGSFQFIIRSLSADFLKTTS